MRPHSFAPRTGLTAVLLSAQLLVPGPSFAQASTAPAAPPASGAAAPDSVALTLDDALRRLSVRHPALAAARAGRDVADAARDEALSGLRNHLIPVAAVSFASQRLAQNQFTAIARRAGITPPPLEQADPFTQVFSAPNTRTATATASIRLLDGGVAAARVRAASHALAAAALDEGQTRAALELAVVERYTELQLQRRLLEVADSGIAQSERTLRVTRRAFDAGRAAAFDVWRAEAAVAAQRPAQLEAQRLVRLADLALRQLIDLPADVRLRLDTPLELPVDSGALPKRGDPMGARTALRAAALREQEAAAQHDAARRALLPTLDISLVHQRLAYPLRASTWDGPYFQNTTVVAQVALPIDLTGGTTARIAHAAAALRVAQADRRAAEQAVERDALEATLLVETAQGAWDAAEAGAASAEQAWRVAVARYDVGRSSLLELQQTQLDLQQALAARARAARDRTLTLARVRRLDRLPLPARLP